MTGQRVSVIIPYYSHGRHLHQTVHAALCATRATLEVIIVDDGAKEAKAETYLYQAQALSPAVTVIRKPNGGLSSARNAGLAAASGDFIQLLDSDDLLTPGKIDLQIAQLESQPSFDISITNYLICDEEATLFQRDGDPISRFDFTLGDFLYKWERGFSIPIHCALFRKRVFNDVRFDTSVVGKEDWILWCKLAHARRRFGYVPVYGAIYRQHGGGMSKSFAAMGESWLRAAEVVDGMLAGSEPAFLPACREWYDAFYAPQIEKRAREASGIHGTMTSAATPVAESLDHAWIDALSEVRGATTGAPFMSVIVPVYNHYDHLRECLTSALQQDARGPVEVVIIDDASRDPRVKPLLQAILERIKGATVVFNDRNLGIAESQNIAAHTARGEYIAWLDCDDVLEPNALSRVSEALSSPVDYLFTDRTDVDERGAVLRVARYGGYPNIAPGGSITDDLADGMVASHLKVMRRSAYLELGGCDPAFSGIQDWELALRFAAQGRTFSYLPQALYRHRIHANSVTRGESVRQFWLTNVARRRHLQRSQPRNIDESETRRLASAACLAIVRDEAPKDPSIFVVTDMRADDALASLKRAWLDSRVCVYVATPNAPVQEWNLVREYNAYFDVVLAPDEAAACFFLGYMWDHHALLLAHDLAMMDATSV